MSVSLWLAGRSFDFIKLARNVDGNTAHHNWVKSAYQKKEVVPLYKAIPACVNSQTHGALHSDVTLHPAHSRCLA